MQTIVVGIDGSDGSRHALQWAVEEAQIRRAHLIAVHAWHLPAATVGSPYAAAMSDPEAFAEAAADILHDTLAEIDTSGVAEGVDQRVVHAPPAQGLLEAAEGAHLLVVGSRGLGGFKGLLLGSVSQQVAHHATSPVVIVPST